MGIYVLLFIPFHLFGFTIRMASPSVPPFFPATLSSNLHPTFFDSPPAHCITRRGPPLFASSLRLLSDDRHLPLALNSHIQRSNFDPDFVATLLSRDSSDDIVDIVLDIGCTFTAAHKELLLWHTRLGHLGFAHVQQLMCPTVAISLPTTDSHSSKPETNEPCIVPKHPTARICKPPLCAACQIARAKKRTADVSTTIIHKDDMLLKIGDLRPGDAVSIDQYESSVRGRLAIGRRKGSFGNKYSGGTMFCDHTSGYI
jgi:hypothetical protein